MKNIDEVIAEVYQGQAQQKQISDAHLALIKGQFIIPTEKTEGEARVLFLSEGEQRFLPVFSEDHYYQQWVQEIKDSSDFIKVTGSELFKGLGANVYLCLNIGSPNYKEFCPQEIARLKSIVIKLFPD